MRLKITKVNIEGIDKNDAFNILNELRSSGLTDKMVFHQEFPGLHKLYRLLNGAFDSAHEGVHFLRDD